MTNHVSYHSRTRLLRKLDDLIEIGKYSDFTSPYIVLLPQDTINLCLQSSILNLNNEVVRAKDFYRSYGYISSKSISRILAQLMTGVRYSLSFSRGVLSQSHAFKFTISDIQFSRYIFDLYTDGQKVGYIISYLLPTTYLNQLYYDEETRKPAFYLEKIMTKSYSTKEQLTSLGNSYYELAKPVPRMLEFRSE